MQLCFVPESGGPSLVDQHNVQTLRFFTDGSKLQGKVGIALFIWDGWAELWSRKLCLLPACGLLDRAFGHMQSLEQNPQLQSGEL